MDDFLDMPFLNEDHVGRHLTLGLLARCMSFLEPYDTRVMFGRISTLDRFRQGFKEWLFALLGLGRFSQCFTTQEATMQTSGAIPLS